MATTFLSLLEDELKKRQAGINKPGGLLNDQENKIVNDLGIPTEFNFDTIGSWSRKPDPNVPAPSFNFSSALTDKGTQAGSQGSSGALDILKLLFAGG